MKDKLILALSGNDIFSGGGLHAEFSYLTQSMVCMVLEL